MSRAGEQLHPEQPGAAARADLYRDLFSLADVDHVFSTPSLHSSTIRVIRDGSSLSFDRIGSVGDHAAIEELLAEHRSGATIALTALNRTFPSLRDLCHTLGRQLSAAFQANAYLTPPISQGFDTHHDTHDVSYSSSPAPTAGMCSRP